MHLYSYLYPYPRPVLYHRHQQQQQQQLNLQETTTQPDKQESDKMTFSTRDQELRCRTYYLETFRIKFRKNPDPSIKINIPCSSPPT